MSLTLNLKRTGAAAHGHDELEPQPKPYKELLAEAGEKVRKLIDNDADFYSLVIRLESARMLDTFEQIISQCAAWDADQPLTPATGSTMKKTIHMDGTYPNPFIQGGEIRELTSWIDNSQSEEDMPF